MSKVCPKCNNTVEDNDKFCAACGEQIESKVENSVIVCGNCGSKNSINDSFCIECGKKLDNKKASVQNEHHTQKKNKTVEKTSEEVNSGEEKSLSKGKVYTIFAGVVGLIVIILIAGGLFDQNAIPSISPQPSTVPKIALENLKEINELDAKVKADPNNLELLLQLANLRNDSGFFQKAIESYQAYLKKRPKDVDARIDMGVSYYNLKNFAKAIEEMEKAIKIQPDHQIGLLNLGIVNFTAGNVDKAKEWLKKAVKIDPDSRYGKKAKEFLKVHQ